jgi:rare lipoprotein A (peptidoglycan hydrolase)
MDTMDRSGSHGLSGDPSQRSGGKKRGMISRLKMKWATGLMVAGGLFSHGQATAATTAKPAPKSKSTTGSKFKSSVKRAATSVKKAAGNNFALLNKYKQDLKRFGAAKLEGYSEKMNGIASWYGGYFHGRLTASGRRFSTYAHMAAHKSLPFGTLLRVTNPDNGKSVVVEILDRGPYVANRMLDLSQATAKELGFHGDGIANVKAEILKMGNLRYEVEAPFSAAEMRGDVVSHRIDMTGVEQASTAVTPSIAEASGVPSGSGSFSLEAAFRNVIPTVQQSADAVATSIRDAVAGFRLGTA